MALTSATVAVPEILTVAVAATTELAGVTNAAVTSLMVPVMLIAFVTVTIPMVAEPIALKSVALIVAGAASEIVTATELEVCILLPLEPAFVISTVVTSTTLPVTVAAAVAVTNPVVKPSIVFKSAAAIEPVSVTVTA